MNEVYFDPGDYFDTATGPEVYTVFTSNATVYPGEGREGQAALKGGNIRKTFSGSASAALGCAIKWITPSWNADMFSMYNALGSDMIAWGVTAAGIPFVENVLGTQTRIVGDGSFSFANNQYYYVVLRATLTTDATNTFVSASLYVDGTLRITFPAADLGTTASVGSTLNGFYQTVSAERRCDLYYSFDESVWWPNLVVLSNPPTGDGTYTDWTPSSAGAHYLMIDEAPPDDDSTYISDGAVVGNRDSHTYTFSPPSGSLVGVELLSDMRQDAAGTVEITQFYRTAATNYAGTANVVNSNYQVYWTSWLTNPNTGVGWTGGDITGGEFGEHRSA